MRSSRCELEVDRFAVIEVDVPRVYERAERLRVDSIAASIAATDTLFEVAIYDPTANVLIDGQHRLCALMALGIRYLPVYQVDYQGSEVDVRSSARRFSEMSWNDALDIASMLSRRSPHESCARESAWSVVVRSGRSRSHTLRCGDPYEASDAVWWFCELGRARGWQARYAHEATSTDLRQEGCEVVVQPIIDKPWVMDAVRTNRRFAPQANRHLIRGRPIGAGIPLGVLRLQKYEAVRRLHEHLRALVSEHRDGMSLMGRLYEEDVVLLSREAARPSIASGELAG